MSFSWRFFSLGFGFSSFNSFCIILYFLFDGAVAGTKSSIYARVKNKRTYEIAFPKEKKKGKLTFLVVESHYYVCSSFKDKQTVCFP